MKICGYAQPWVIDGAGVRSLAQARIDPVQWIFRHPECLPLANLAPRMGTPVPVCRNLATPEGTVGVLMLGPCGELVAFGVPEAAEALCDLDYYGLEDAVADACNDRRLLSERMCGRTALDAKSFARAVDLNLDLGRMLVVMIGEMPSADRTRISSSISPSIIRPAEASDPPLLIWPEPFVRSCRPLTGAGDRRKRLYGALETQNVSLPVLLRQFLFALEPFGIIPWFGRTLSLVWPAPSGPVVLAQISPSGHVTTDVEAASLSVSANALAHRYVRTLAAGLGYSVVPSGEVLCLRTPSGELPHLGDLAPYFDVWGEALGAFVTGLRFAAD